MAAAPSGSASYKKKDGTLTVSKDHKSISWIPAAGGAGGAVTVAVKNMTNLQQTPANNPKVMLKIFAQQNDTQENYVFTFTSGANARAEADAIKEALSAAITAAKAASAPVPEVSTNDGVSAAMAMANAISSAGTGQAAWDDDNKLKTDAELQQSLLKCDPNLQRMFMESLRTKPESLSGGNFVSQFWSTRVHLLRAHAIERAQLRGSYNVLSSLKPRTDNNVTKLNISKEQIQLIFNQHPLVKKVYDENVPKLSEQQFWSRFFQSRLFKKLRGERLSESDATDNVLDKYLTVDEHADRVKDAHVPHFIDLAGNEVNHSQRQGNRPDFDMRPASIEKVPIIRTLNALSEKIMANVAPADGDPSAPVGMDEETYNQLMLQDLKGDEEQTRIMLNIRDQSRFFAQGKQHEGKEGDLLAKQDPEKVITSMRGDVAKTFDVDGLFHLGKIIEPDEDDSDEENAAPKHAVGSKASLQRASTQIFGAIRERRAQTEVSPNAGTWGLSTSLFDRLTLTHATTTEFLHQFWHAFLSGNPERAGELASLVESLSRAMDRIKAVAADAESERETEVNRLKQNARDVFAATGKKIRVNLAGVGGGEKVVNQLLGPTISALSLASNKYKEAFAEATAAASREDSLAP